jgi:hypothetical protein
MKFTELERRVHRDIPNLRRAVVWYSPDEFTNAAYVVVPLIDGRFTIYHPSGRGDYYPDYDPDGNQRFFADEDEVCDFVWVGLNTPEPPQRRIADQTPEQAADQRRRFEEGMRNASRQRGMKDPHASGDAPT